MRCYFYFYFFVLSFNLTTDAAHHVGHENRFIRLCNTTFNKVVITEKTVRYGVEI